MKHARTLSVVGAVIGGALLVGACDAGDQGRPLNYKKGVYLGKPDTPLDKQTLDQLRARAGYQSGLSAGSGGGPQAGASASSSSVRPPDTGGVDAGALRHRTGRQSQ